MLPFGDIGFKSRQMLYRKETKKRGAFEKRVLREVKNMVECPICSGAGECLKKPGSCDACTFNKAKPNGVACQFGEKCPTCKGTGDVDQEEIDAVYAEQA